VELMITLRSLCKQRVLQDNHLNASQCWCWGWEMLRWKRRMHLRHTLTLCMWSQEDSPEPPRATTSTRSSVGSPGEFRACAVLLLSPSATATAAYLLLRLRFAVPLGQWNKGR
jgi:hypothetical protein